MTDKQYHIAQVNIAHMKASLEEPVMAGFVARLDEINALADSSPGFVWRLESDEGDATSIQAFDDPLILINMSVWESIEALHDFVYSTKHIELLRSKTGWFNRAKKSHLALWWVREGHLPTEAEAKERLELLDTEGPNPDVFTFSRRYPPPHLDDQATPKTGLQECPWTP